MCCFSRPVASVHDTRIFARMVENGVQYLIYQMHLEAGEDLAMILPVPTVAGLGDEGLRFIDLSGYPTLFDDMRKPFDEGRASLGRGDPFGGIEQAKPLQVHRVGNYEASFVPRVADFARLDPRFRLPPGTWDQLPGYAGHGFAVFKLHSGNALVHPMAFLFRSATPETTFVPTVHIHDGKVHESAGFDHEIYLQGGFPRAMTRLTGAEAQPRWVETPQIPMRFLKMRKTKGVIHPAEHIYRLTLRGKYLNRDLHVRQRAA